MRERLNTSGLFADVDVFWKPYRDGVRVNIVIRDKFPWAPVPTFSYAPGNLSAGLLVAHGNLFGRGKRGIIGGRLSTADSGAILAYQDPAVFGSWLFYQFSGAMQDQTIPEYPNAMDLPAKPGARDQPAFLRLLGQAGRRLVPAGEDQRGLVDRQVPACAGSAAIPTSSRAASCCRPPPTAASAPPPRRS